MEEVTFGKWVRYLTREWKHDHDQDTEIAFAIRMATFAPDGGRVFVTAPTLAQLAGVDERTARRRRKLCIELGMFRGTGEFHVIPGGGKIEELELALPPHRDARAELPYRDRAVVTGNKREVKRESLNRESDARAELPYREPARSTTDNTSAGTSLRSVSTPPRSSHRLLGSASPTAHRGVVTAPKCDRCRGPILGYQADHVCPSQAPVCYDCNARHWGYRHRKSA